MDGREIALQGTHILEYHVDSNGSSNKIKDDNNNDMITAQSRAPSKNGTTVCVCVWRVYANNPHRKGVHNPDRLAE